MRSRYLIVPYPCSVNRGDASDREIDEENRSTKDFMILVSLIDQSNMW